MVIVFTANNRDLKVTAGLMSRFIFPACSETLLERYSKYCVSFDYPIGISIMENGSGMNSYPESPGMFNLGLSILLRIST